MLLRIQSTILNCIIILRVCQDITPQFFHSFAVMQRMFHCTGILPSQAYIRRCAFQGREYINHGQGREEGHPAQDEHDIPG
jgi:hypothetical protein